MRVRRTGMGESEYCLLGLLHVSVVGGLELYLGGGICTDVTRERRLFRR